MPRGGKRSGSGRPVVKLSRTLVPLKKVQAEQILASIDEQGAWIDLLTATSVSSVAVIGGEDGLRENVTQPDYKIRIDALKYLTNRRDGMPPQAIQHEGAGGGAVKIVVEHIGRPQDTATA